MQPVLPHEVDTFGKWFQQSKAKNLEIALAQKSRTPLILVYMIFHHLPSKGCLKTNCLMNIVIDYPMRYYETTLRLGLYTWDFPISACLQCTIGIS